MNKDKYSFEPIKIRRMDFKKYTDIAFAIDNPVFIKEAKKIRKKYGIKEPLGISNYQHWLITNLGKKTIPIFYKEITGLRTAMDYESNYQDVFEKAVLGCEIIEGDYTTTKLINFSKLPPFLKYDSTFLWAILITPQTKKEDIVKTFNKYRKMLKDTQQSQDTYSITDEYNKRRNEIERDRRWYWKKTQGMKYRQIANEEGMNDEDFYISKKDLIVKAIKAYREKLL